MILVIYPDSSSAAIFKKKQKPYLVLSETDLKKVSDLSSVIKKDSIFRTNSRIYFLVYCPYGFKSDYIKYQIVRQDDKAHVGGYTRIRNITRRVSDKYKYSDYFVLTQPGKYIIQIFDITNLHQWITYGVFLVVDE